MNVAVGGDYLGDPDADQLFAYPEGEMWVDWVKWYTLCDLGWGSNCAPIPVPTSEPTAEPPASTPEPTPKPTTVATTTAPDFGGDNPEGLVCDDDQPCPSYFEDSPIWMDGISMMYQTHTTTNCNTTLQERRMSGQKTVI